MNLVITSLQFFIGLLIYLLTLPFLLIWRLSLSLLLPFAASKPALSHSQKCRNYLHTHPIVKTVARKRVNIMCITMLLLLITLAFALLEKSLIYFVPWITSHFQRTQYRHEYKKAWCSELILYLAGFMLSCIPTFIVLGVAAGMLYYTCEPRMYERLLNKTTTVQPEARESSVADVESEGERFTVVRDGAIEEWLAKRPCNALYKTSLHGLSQRSELGLIQGDEHDLGESFVSAPPLVAIPTQLATVVRFKRNPYTSAGVMSIWGSRNGWLAGGYDGWSVRRGNFQDDIEMAECVGKRE